MRALRFPRSFAFVLASVMACSSVGLDDVSTENVASGDPLAGDAAAASPSVDAGRDAAQRKTLDGGVDAIASDARARDGAVVGDAAIGDAAPDDASVGDAGGCAAAKGGCGAVQLTPWGSTRTKRLRADGTDVFFTGPSESLVYAVPAGGGTVRKVGAASSTENVGDLVLDGAYAYVCSADVFIPHTVRLWRVPKAGGAAEELITTTSPRRGCAVATDGADIFFAANGTLTAWSKTSKATRVVASGRQLDPEAMAVVGSTLYLVGSGLESVPKAGGTVASLWHPGPINPDTRHVAVANGLVYVSNGGDGLVYRRSAAGVMSPFNQGFATPGSGMRMTADDADVFWAQAYSGTVYRSPTATSAPSVLAQNLDYTDALAVDGSHLYVALYDGTRSGLTANAIFAIPR